VIFIKKKKISSDTIVTVTCRPKALPPPCSKQTAFCLLAVSRVQSMDNVDNVDNLVLRAGFAGERVDNVDNVDNLI